MPRSTTLESTVRARRKSAQVSLGWSLDELADRTHLSASTISRIETRKRTVSLDVLEALCRGLQVNINAVLDAPAKPERPGLPLLVRPGAVRFEVAEIIHRRREPRFQPRRWVVAG